MTQASRSVSLLVFISLIVTSLVSPMAMAAEHFVRIVTDYEAMQMAFEPKILTIEPGDRVTWINDADEEHNVVTFPDGYPRGADGFRSPKMKRAGDRFSHQFDVPGTYEYHCVPHLPMGMQGVIVVGRPSPADALHRPTTEETNAYRDLLLEWFEEDDLPMRESRERIGGADRDLAIDHER